jgi:hypothetical protein
MVVTSGHEDWWRIHKNPHSSVGIGRTTSGVPGGVGQFATSIIVRVTPSGHGGHDSAEEVGMKKLIVSITILISLIAASIGLSGVQTELPPPETLPNNFPDLARLRTRLVEREIPQAQKELTQLRRRQESAELREKFYEGELATVKRQIELLQRQEPPNTSEMTSLEKKFAALQERFDEAKQVDFTEAISQKEAEIFDKQQLLASVEDTIQDLLNPDTAKQRFKSTVSMVFAALVGTVICGFFVIAFRDERVRQAIFSGQAGMQFVTLFSLVIAIILFGITSILEAKELAALLGGLSGYILGRVTAERPPVTIQGTAPHPTSPVPSPTSPIAAPP